MKKLFTILAAALFVVACGGGNAKKEEPKSIEDQLLKHVAKIEKAVKADNYEKAIDLYWAFEEWVDSLDDEQYDEFEEAFEKNEKRLYILDEVGSAAYYEEDEGMYCEDDECMYCEDDECMYYEDDECEPEVPMVYSNCFDGYLNVRAGASTKSQVLGILRNGEAAELLSVEGKWTKVRVNGIEGYIWTADTQTTPSDPVYISSASVIGEWMWADANGHLDFCTIESNGDFNLYGHSHLEDSSGKWHLSGHNLVLKVDNGETYVCSVTGRSIIIDGREYEKM